MTTQAFDESVQREIQRMMAQRQLEWPSIEAQQAYWAEKENEPQQQKENRCILAN